MRYDKHHRHDDDDSGVSHHDLKGYGAEKCMRRPIYFETMPRLDRKESKTTGPGTPNCVIANRSPCVSGTHLASGFCNLQFLYSSFDGDGIFLSLEKKNCVKKVITFCQDTLRRALFVFANCKQINLLLSVN